ncbi:uncharacterized protein LOC124886550 [Capsicum annuum]|uniref:uncharacterized protein LOC124886550 n=1 Tax=Capsicum annuum TaxID=4072 RepID=UPI001FB170E9|nr:uncharacterized protein LOC124886550 [Capsicum annuum]
MISKAIDDPSQRENLFHTKCLVKGSVCTLVIDSGSCANIVSVAMVNFLKLPTTLHTSPYKLQWLNECGELKVMRQCVIRFKVGNYHDEVLCDVIPMQACHLLLGRPWQYDRSTKHDGRSNRYTLEKDGRKVTLHPLLPSQVNELHQRMKELKEKGKKYENKEKKGEPVGGVVGVSGAASISNGKETMVMLVRKKKLFVDHDEDTPMLLLAHCFNTNLTNSSISPLISRVAGL